MINKITKCRICGNSELAIVTDLGMQNLTGIFPKSESATITTGPLILVKCVKDGGCGLLQLQHTYNLDELYGENYGYQSKLNKSMVDHLHGKVKKILQLVKLDKNDLIIDIGSNDSTTLQAYSHLECKLLGIDPTGEKFKQYYPEYIDLIPDFFAASAVKEKYGDKKAKIITSFAMFYDLEEPLLFMQEIYDILDDNGIWVFEQSYMPEMLITNSFDTICHEHLEYYSLKQIQWMADRIGFKIVDLEFNDINGGSFSITVAKKDSFYPEIKEEVKKILDKERQMGLDGLEVYSSFAKRVENLKEQLIEMLEKINSQGQKVYGLGASTKGNVLLQYCGLTKKNLPYIGEVNSEKYGCYTPGSAIPIISEDELLNMNPDYLLVLPWHFKNFFVNSEKFRKTKLIFPLPQIKVHPEE